MNDASELIAMIQKFLRVSDVIRCCFIRPKQLQKICRRFSLFFLDFGHLLGIGLAVKLILHFAECLDRVCNIIERMNSGWD